MSTCLGDNESSTIDHFRFICILGLTYISLRRQRGKDTEGLHGFDRQLLHNNWNKVSHSLRWFFNPSEPITFLSTSSELTTETYYTAQQWIYKFEDIACLLNIDPNSLTETDEQDARDGTLIASATANDATDNFSPEPRGPQVAGNFVVQEQNNEISQLHQAKSPISRPAR
jgi:hypothetical protein